MFSQVGFFEVLLIGIVLLVVVGPEQMPGLVRRAAKLFGQAKKASNSMRNEFMSTMHEIEKASDVGKWVDDAADAIVAPIKDLSSELEDDGLDLSAGAEPDEIKQVVTEVQPERKVGETKTEESTDSTESADTQTVSESGISSTADESKQIDTETDKETEEPIVNTLSDDERSQAQPDNEDPWADAEGEVV